MTEQPASGTVAGDIGARGLDAQTGPTDGPVSLKSARLKGVSDFVVLPADHAALYLPIDQKTPASWDVIRSRLSR